MEKTKLFMTITTLCLATAGVAGTKANGKINEWGYRTDTQHHCTRATGIACSSLIGTGCLDIDGTQLARFDGDIGCLMTLKKN